MTIDYQDDWLCLSIAFVAAMAAFLIVKIIIKCKKHIQKTAKIFINKFKERRRNYDRR